ncbi:MAG TPA: hypothetical protein PKH79_02435 [Prolixibacteraceae bacterium]|nr:hypothetical protein [Prolixibacteraceae bacterium]HPS13388.1 hypothetical protein [Prolixibacteraceae bacterium]
MKTHTKLFFKILLLIPILIGIAGCNSSSENDSEEKLLNWEPRQHPYLAANGRNNVHNDSYMTDSYTLSGPEGNNLKLTFFTTPRVFITIAFDRQGRIISLGTGGDSKRAAYLLDPDSMKMIDAYELPAGTDLSASGAGYFYLDNNDQMIVPTTNKHIYKLGIEGNPSKFVLKTDYDLTALPDPCHIISVLPDWKGNMWFLTEEGIAGIITEDGTINFISLTHTQDGTIVQEKIGNSFAVDETGAVFVVSDYALYSLIADSSKKIKILWREEYDRGTQQKQGQFTQGSGTTPTLISDEYVTITDNAEPRMNVLVYKRQQNVKGDRLLCKIPVFTENASATENSLIAFHNSIIVENNYGYTKKAVDFVGKFTEPGMTRIDFHANGDFDVKWESDVIVPSLVSKVAMGNNTVYTYTKETDGWYLTGLDLNTGSKKFQTKAGGDDVRYNNHYSGLAIGPNGSVYIGCAGGIIRFYEK